MWILIFAVAVVLVFVIGFLLGVDMNDPYCFEECEEDDDEGQDSGV